MRRGARGRASRLLLLRPLPHRRLVEGRRGPGGGRRAGRRRGRGRGVTGGRRRTGRGRGRVLRGGGRRRGGRLDRPHAVDLPLETGEVGRAGRVALLLQLDDARERGDELEPPGVPVVQAGIPVSRVLPRLRLRALDLPTSGQDGRPLGGDGGAQVGAADRRPLRGVDRLGLHGQLELLLELLRLRLGLLRLLLRRLALGLLLRLVAVGRGLVARGGAGARPQEQDQARRDGGPRGAEAHGNPPRTYVRWWMDAVHTRGGSISSRCPSALVEAKKLTVWISFLAPTSI